MRRWLLLLALAASACAAHARTGPAIVSPEQRLAEADALVRAGCYDCLVDALAQYRQLAAASPRASAGARVAAGLLAIRERDLGLVDQHYLEQARDDEDGFLPEVIGTIPRRYAGVQFVGDEAQIASLMVVSRNRDAWRERLAAVAGAGILPAVAALAFECTHGGKVDERALDPLLARIGTLQDTPLVRFSRATCGTVDAGALAALIDANPRFAEINYFLGLAATLKGHLDEADARFERALAWRQDWPAVTIAVANMALTAEDFARAAEFYQRTLAILPGNADAELGRVRALSYGGEHVEALAAADALLAGGRWYLGDAYYWRAWNEAQIGRDERAWADVHEAAKLIFNADVPKLTGVLAARRDDLPTARREFELAHARNAQDCETAALLGGAELELRDWPGATGTLTGAVECLDARDTDLRAEITRLQGSQRSDRLIAHRTQEIEGNRQLRIRSWFNLAVAAFNAGDKAAARLYAERLASDVRFGERARQLLDQLKP